MPGRRTSIDHFCLVCGIRVERAVDTDTDVVCIYYTHVKLPAKPHVPEIVPICGYLG